MKSDLRLLVLITLLSALFILHSAYAYENAEYGFSIAEPAGWDVLEDEEGIAVGFTDPNLDVTGASINVAVQETSLSFSSYVEASKQTIENKDGYTLESEGSRTVGGLEGYELVSMYTQMVGDVQVNVTLKQVVFVENGKGYVITVGALKLEYDNFNGTFEQSINSFRITSEPTNDGTDLTGVAVVAGVIVVVVVIGAFYFLKIKQKPHN